MKSILVPVEDHDRMAEVLTYACAVAATFGAGIKGVALGPDLAELVTADVAISGLVYDERMRRTMLREAADLFGRMTAQAGVAAHWAGERSMSLIALGEEGRVHDLTIVGRPGAASNEPRRATLEAALFDSGRPILIVPPRAPGTIGRRIAIAWNGSSETARTLAFALPFLTRADDVVLLAVPGLRLPGPAEDDVVRHLRRHAVPARCLPVAEQGRRPARAFLDAAAELDVDLIVKGGYTQSRIRQIFFGSVTADILAEADLPVFMAH